MTDSEAIVRDKFELLRTRILRRLVSEVELLEDSLSAVRKNPPKIRVVEDHIDRVLEGLNREIALLKKDTL